METWDDMLKEYETLIYIPISSGLSGSCMTAQGLAQDEEYEGKVFVVDNGHVSTPLHRSVLDAVEMAEAGYSAVEIIWNRSIRCISEMSWNEKVT